MSWMATAVIFAATLPATAAVQERDGDRERADRPAARAVDCRQVVTRPSDDPWARLCLPGNPLLLGSSFGWVPDARRERPRARGPEEKASGHRGRPSDSDARGRDADGRPGDGPRPVVDRDGRGDDRPATGGANGPAACATGVDSGCGATVTPEPVTMVLLGSGLAGIAGARLRRRRAAGGQ